MSTFFQQTAQAMIAKHIDRFPLLKLDQVIDWQPIEQYLNRQRTRYLRDHRGRPAYPLLSMFKAVLLGQWHSLSDPELKHSLITRIDFNLFCRFDELIIPDYSTLRRYRNWLAQDDTLSELLKLINRQLTEKGLKVEKVSAAVIDATIIQTAGSKQRQAIEVDEEGQVSGQTTPSKDSNARWIKKNGLYKLGYKQHTRTDAEGYIEKLHITPANAHECKHLSPLLEGLPKGTTVYADKGYDCEENRQHLNALHRAPRHAVLRRLKHGGRHIGAVLHRHRHQPHPVAKHAGYGGGQFDGIIQRAAQRSAAAHGKQHGRAGGRQ